MSDESAIALRAARSLQTFPTEEVRENAWLLWEGSDVAVAKATVEETMP